MTDLQTVNGYSDGACKRNPGPGGWGSVLYMDGIADLGFDGYRFIDYGGKEHTTNQEMELLAFLNTLKMCKGIYNYTIHSDSSYVVEALLGKGIKNGEIGVSKMGKSASFPGYISSWMSKGWKKADNGPVKHDHLWKDIVKTCGEIVVSGSKLNVKWVKGHSGIDGNELADELANLGVPKC